MTVKISGKYLGNKKVELTHLPSGSVIRTDAPKDNQGEGSLFSPTDLVAAGLGSCLLTIIAIVAERDDINVVGMHMNVEKHMASSPRRIAQLPVSIHLPSAIDEPDRGKLEAAARACPVHHSLAIETKIALNFIYDV
jgi:putative redox protein